MSFKGDVNKAFASFEQGVQDFTVRIGNEAHASLVELSPVDLGTFVGNWEYYPQEFPVINIRNNTEYGPYLENGSSQQAPNGMVRVTFNALVGKYGR